MKKILVSIVIPTRNRQEFLKEAIDSVLSQTYKHIELIITDDNSTDNTKDFVKNYLRNKNIDYKFVINKKYKNGPNGNKNNGLDYCTGELIGILDDDDKLFPSTIEQLVTVYLKTKSKQIITNSIRSDNGKLAGNVNFRGHYLTYKDVLCERADGQFWGIGHKDFLGKTRFNDKQWGGEATTWWGFYKLEPAYYYPKITHWYRIHTGSVCFKLENIDRRILNYVNLLKLYGTDLIKYNARRFAKLNYSVSLLYAIEKDYKNAHKYYNESKKYVGFNVTNSIKFLICLYVPRKWFPKLFNIKEKIIFNLKKIFI